MKNYINTRLVAFNILNEVLNNGVSLSKVISKNLLLFENKIDRSFVHNLVIGVLRWNIRLEAIIDNLLKKPLKKKDADINLLLKLGLYQIIYMKVADHAAVSETVELTKKLKKNWAKNIVNAILRNFIRQQTEILNNIDLKPYNIYSHPIWFLKKVKKYYPYQWENILKANNIEKTIYLRTNILIQTRDCFIKELRANNIEAEPHPHSPQAVKLKRNYEITKLPSYAEGGFSVQDISAQQASILLNPQPNEVILDACAAPGGKATHIQELSNNKAELTCLEKDITRVERLKKNINRLKIKAKVIQVDAIEIDKWWNGKFFDKILLDAPCSATGIIRRYPDIKINRKEKDIENIINIQENLLNLLWKILKPGGLFLYSTCSVLPEENSNQIKKFLKKKDYLIVNVDIPFSYKNNDIGEQILPFNNVDGFYYALLKKRV